MNHDLEAAVRMALEPDLQDPELELCCYCGAFKSRVAAHVCRTSPLEFPGAERDEKRRAKSYAIE